MKTKTKTNLKRAILFFIPLCLIAGMLAVPAFAVPVTYYNWNAVNSSSTLAPTTITEWANGAVFPEADTAGMYAIVFDDLINDIADANPSGNGVDIFPGFTGVGYLELAYDNGSHMYYTFGSQIDSNANDIEVSIVYDDMQEAFGLRIGRFDGTTTTISTGLATYIFYFTQYPPCTIGVASDAYSFWSASASYTAFMVSDDQSTPDPDPEPPAGGDDGAGETSGIFAVWTQITDWIINGLKSTTSAFYYNGQLTLLGYLCIIPLALGVALLLISIIQKFLHLRG